MGKYSNSFTDTSSKAKRNFTDSSKTKTQPVGTIATPLSQITGQQAPPKKSVVSQLIKPLPIIDTIKKMIRRTPEQSKQDLQSYNKSNPEIAYIASKGKSFSAGVSNGATLGLNQKLLDLTTDNQATPIYDQAQKENPKLYTGGEIAGSIAPWALAESGIKMIAKPILRKFTSSLGKRAVIGSAAGAIVGGTQSAIEGDSIKDIAKETVLGAGLGLGGELVGAGLQKGVSAIARKIKSPRTFTSSTPVQKLEPPQQIVDAQSAQGNINTFNESTSAVNGAKDVKNAKSLNPAFETSKQLKNTNTKVKKVSKFKTNSLKSAQFLDNETSQKVVDSVEGSYGFKPDKEVIENVSSQLQNNFDSIKNNLLVKGLNSKEDSVASALIARDLVQKGDYAGLRQLIHKVQPEATNAGQIIQGLSQWKKLSPEATLLKAQQLISSSNKELVNKLGLKAKLKELTDDEAKFIIEGMQKVESAADDTIKDIEFAKVKQFMADLTPVEFRDKLKGLQRISLILNPKSLLVRNPLGNTILGAAENIKDIPGAFIDSVTSAIRGSERTTALNPIPKLKGQVKGFGKGLKDWARDIKYNVDTSPTRAQMELPNGRTFDNTILNSIDQLERRMLQLGDRPFYESAYQGRIAELKGLQKIKEPTEEMIQDAKLYALDRVFQNDSELSKRVLQLRSSLGIVGDLVMPFAQTPANLFDKLLDYSPVGLGKGLYHLGTTKGTGLFNQKLFVDRLSRFMTGSGITALGYVLASKGLATGKANKDTDIASFERNLGKNSYAFKIGDTYQTFDFAQPISGLLAAGVDAYLGGQDKDNFVKQITGSAESAVNTMLRQSMLQGIMNLVSGYSPAAAIGKTLLGTTTQITPTAGKQIAQAIDPNVRETYNANPIKQAANNIIARTPGASMTLPAKVDTFGNEIKNFQGKTGAAKLFDVFLNPGFTNEYKPNATQKEIMRIYEVTGEKVQFPRVADKSIEYQNTATKKKEKIELSPQEYTQYQKTLGKLTTRKFEAFMAEKSYKLYTDEKKATELQQLITQANKEAKQQILEQKGLAKPISNIKKSRVFTSSK